MKHPPPTHRNASECASFLLQVHCKCSRGSSVGSADTRAERQPPSEGACGCRAGLWALVSLGGAAVASGWNDNVREQVQGDRKEPAGSTQHDREPGSCAWEWRPLQTFLGHPVVV